MNNTLNQRACIPIRLIRQLAAKKNGPKVLSDHLINPGKYDEASAYLRKFMTEFFDIEGYSYEFSNWSTIEEAMESIGQQPPAR